MIATSSLEDGSGARREVERVVAVVPLGPRPRQGAIVTHWLSARALAGEVRPMSAALEN